jgi:hypothetical protein
MFPFTIAAMRGVLFWWSLVPTFAPLNQIIKKKFYKLMSLLFHQSFNHLQVVILCCQVQRGSLHPVFLIDDLQRTISLEHYML